MIHSKLQTVSFMEKLSEQTVLTHSQFQDRETKLSLYHKYLLLNLKYLLLLTLIAISQHSSLTMKQNTVL